MADKGQFLEIMMANLQSYLGPEGVEVKLREKFYNPETGKQIGEIDITARGDFGTSKFFWGIECRDRPAEGPQGLPWIREIVGKKRQLKPDKMIAVSSTGFTDDAEEFAASENIDLITIDEPTEEILKEWFEIFTVTYTDWRIKRSGGVTINLIGPETEPPAEALQIKGGDLIFTMPPFEMQPQSFDALVETKVKPLIAGLDPDARDPMHEIPLEIPAPLSVELGGRTYALKNATTQIDLTPHSNSVRALFNVCRRESDKHNIALTSKSKIQVKDKEIVTVILARKNVGGTMSLRISLYDEDGNEATLPDGIVMEMWGRGKR